MPRGRVRFAAVLLSPILALALAAGCQCTRPGRPDAGRGDAGDADAGPEDAALPDAGNDAGVDAALFDAGTDAGVDAAVPDAGPSVCASTAPEASVIEVPLASAGALALIALDPLGFSVLFADGPATRLARLAPDGTLREAVQDLGAIGTPCGIVHDGAELRIAFWRGPGPETVVAPVDAVGVGAATTVAAGRCMPAALAHHAPSGELAVGWTDAGGLHVTVVAPDGTRTVHDLDPPYLADFELEASIAASPDPAPPHFVAAWPFASATFPDIVVRAMPLAAGATSAVLHGSSTALRNQVRIAADPVTGGYAVIWRQRDTDAGIHLVGLDASGAVTAADVLAVPFASPEWIARGAVVPHGAGIDVLVDTVTGTDRQLRSHPLDRAGAARMAPFRVATVCSLAYNEGPLAFARGTLHGHTAWFELDYASTVVASY